MDQTKPTSAPPKRLAIEKLGIRRLMQLDACTRCGECLNWCPVYDQDRQEKLIPRTKILKFLQIAKNQDRRAAKGLLKSLFGDWGQKMLGTLFPRQEITAEMVTAFAENLYECSTCGQCQVVCPANINTVELWEEIRELIVEAGYGPLEPQKVLVKSVKAYDNPWQQPRQGRTKWIRRAEKEGLLIAPPRDIQKTRGKVLLWFGCTAVYDGNVRQIAINTVNVLEALGIDYGCLLGDEKCCGSVLLRMGDAEFKRIASENIAQLNALGFDTLISACSGCFKTIKEDYPKVGQLNFKVLHVVEYLHELLTSGKLTFRNPVNAKVTYHDPCHLGRAAGVYDAPRAILNAIPGLELTEMERVRSFSRCCGAGGGVKAGFPDIQAKMSLRRIAEAEATGADTLVSACPFCYAGLQVGIKASNSHLVMKDVTSLVAQALIGKEVAATAPPAAAQAEAAAAATPAVATPAADDKDQRRAQREQERAARRAARGQSATPAAQEASPAPVAAPEPAQPNPAVAPAPEPVTAPADAGSHRDQRRAQREQERAARRAARASGEPEAVAPAPPAPEPVAAADPVEAAPEPPPAATDAAADPEASLTREQRRALRDQERAARRAGRG